MSLKSYFASKYPVSSTENITNIQSLQNSNENFIKDDIINRSPKEYVIVPSPAENVMNNENIVAKKIHKEFFDKKDNTMYMILIITLIFFLLNNKYAFNMTSKIFNIKYDNNIPFTLFLIHTILFFILIYIIIYYFL